MLRFKAAAASALSCALLSLPTAASAQHVRYDDPVGDTSTPGLDITSARFANRDHAFVTKLSFKKDRPGAVIVGVKLRGHRHGAVVISRHYRHGPDHPFLVGEPRCSGLTSHWRRAAAELTLRLPARCVSGGNYGAIKTFALIEGLRDGGDVDYAPQKRDGDFASTPWISRG